MYRTSGRASVEDPAPYKHPSVGIHQYTLKGGYPVASCFSSLGREHALGIVPGRESMWAETQEQSTSAQTMTRTWARTVSICTALKNGGPLQVARPLLLSLLARPLHGKSWQPGRPTCLLN